MSTDAIAYWQRRAELAEEAQKAEAQAQADAAALRQPETQIARVVDALCELINIWNDAAEDGDRGRDNKMIVLTLWDDGSGRIGTAHGYEQDTGSFCDVSMNIQQGWNDTAGLVSYLLEWVGGSHVFSGEHPGAQLLIEIEAAHAEIARLEQALRDAARMRTIIGARAIVAGALREEQET